MKKIIITLILILFLVSFVSAEQNDEEFLLRNYKDTNLSVPIFKNDRSVADANVNCYMNLKNPNGEVIFSGRQMTRNSNGEYNVTVLGAEISDTGFYNSVIRCDNTQDYGFSTFQILATPTGQKDLLGFYIIAIVIAYGVIIFGAWKQDITITLLGTFFLYFVGLYMLLFGIDIYKNFLTDGFSIITLGIAAYISSVMAHEYLM